MKHIHETWAFFSKILRSLCKMSMEARMSLSNVSKEYTFCAYPSLGKNHRLQWNTVFAVARIGKYLWTTICQTYAILEAWFYTNLILMKENKGNSIKLVYKCDYNKIFLSWESTHYLSSGLKIWSRELRIRRSLHFPGDWSTKTNFPRKSMHPSGFYTGRNGKIIFSWNSQISLA